MSYVISSEAEIALEDIYIYTAETFGTDQAIAYNEGFFIQFEYLAKYPFMGISTEDLIPGLRKFRFQSHNIFYLVKDSKTYITEILHTRQNVSSHTFDF